MRGWARPAPCAHLCTTITGSTTSSPAAARARSRPQADNGRLEELTSKLLARAESMEQSLEHQAQARAQQQEAEAQLARAREEQLEQARRDLAAARVVEQQLRSDVACQRGELARAAGELAATAAQLSAAQQLASERAAELAQLEGRLSAEKHRAELLQVRPPARVLWRGCVRGGDDWARCALSSRVVAHPPL